MKDDLTINQMMAQLDQQIAWFNSEEFQLEEAKERFLALSELAKEIEHRLRDMKNEIEVLAKDFSEESDFTELKA